MSREENELYDGIDEAKQVSYTFLKKTPECERAID